MLGQTCDYCHSDKPHTRETYYLAKQDMNCSKLVAAAHTYFVRQGYIESTYPCTLDMMLSLLLGGKPEDV